MASLTIHYGLAAPARHESHTGTLAEMRALSSAARQQSSVTGTDLEYEESEAS